MLDIHLDLAALAGVLPGLLTLVTLEVLGRNKLEMLGGPLLITKEKAPLVIPDTAPLITGNRAVVYVAVPDPPGTFQGREVVLGPRAKGYYVVKHGLKAGENVVVNGNFKIDSAIQILAKPSMMEHAGGESMTMQHQHGQTPTMDMEMKMAPKIDGPRKGQQHELYGGPQAEEE